MLHPCLELLVDFGDVCLLVLMVGGFLMMMVVVRCVGVMLVGGF